MVADHHQPRPAVLLGPPVPIVILLKPLTDTLDDEPPVFARDGGESLHPQNVEFCDRALDPVSAHLRRRYLVDFDDDGLEIVMVVLALVVVV